MKKRNPLGVVGLSIITLGIYDLYWLYVTKKELNEKTSHHTPTLWLLIAGPVLLVISYIVMFSGGLKSTPSYTTTGTISSSSHVGGLFFVGLILVIISWLFTLIASVIWSFKFSKAIDEYTNGKMSTAVTFLILYLIHLIGVALIQDTFNNMSGDMAGAANQAMANPMPPNNVNQGPAAPPVTLSPQPPADNNQQNPGQSQPQTVVSPPADNNQQQPPTPTS